MRNDLRGMKIRILCPLIAAITVSCGESSRSPDGTATRYRGGERFQEALAPSGSWVEYYASPESPVARVDEILKSLQSFETFTSVFDGMRVIVTRPQATLTSLEGLGPQFVGEGAASCAGLIPYPQGPVIFIKYDSLMAWDISFAHELLHLKFCHLDANVVQQLTVEWETLKGPGTPSSPYYGNANEMFAYFGQWYLAGYDHLLMEEVPSIGKLLRQILGNATLKPQHMTSEYVRQQIQLLNEKFKGH